MENKLPLCAPQLAIRQIRGYWGVWLISVLLSSWCTWISKRDLKSDTLPCHREDSRNSVKTHLWYSASSAMETRPHVYEWYPYLKKMLFTKLTSTSPNTKGRERKGERGGNGRRKGKRKKRNFQVCFHSNSHENWEPTITNQLFASGIFLGRKKCT